jgi:hypothetical protein
MLVPIDLGAFSLTDQRVSLCEVDRPKIDERMVEKDLSTKKMIIRSIHNDLVGTLRLQPICSRIVTRFLGADTFACLLARRP